MSEFYVDWYLKVKTEMFRVVYPFKQPPSKLFDVPKDAKTVYMITKTNYFLLRSSFILYINSLLNLPHCNKVLIYLSCNGQLLTRIYQAKYQRCQFLIAVFSRQPPSNKIIVALDIGVYNRINGLFIIMRLYLPCFDKRMSSTEISSFDKKPVIAFLFEFTISFVGVETIKFDCK